MANFVLAFNPFKPNGISYSYQLNQSISVLRVVWRYFFFFLFKLQYYILLNKASSGDSDQTPRSALFAYVLQKYARLRITWA